MSGKPFIYSAVKSSANGRVGGRSQHYQIFRISSNSGLRSDTCHVSINRRLCLSTQKPLRFPSLLLLIPPCAVFKIIFTLCGNGGERTRAPLLCVSLFYDLGRQMPLNFVGWLRLTAKRLIRLIPENWSKRHLTSQRSTVHLHGIIVVCLKLFDWIFNVVLLLLLYCFWQNAPITNKPHAMNLLFYSNHITGRTDTGKKVSDITEENMDQ